MHQKLIIFLLGLSLTGCSLPVSPPSVPSPGEAPIPVVATFYPWAYFLAQIGGDHVRVTSVVPNGVEPHDFEPGPGDIAAIRSARVFMYNGAGIDPWAEKLAGDLADEPIVAIRAADGLAMLDASESEHAEEDSHAEGGEYDPHFWLDPVEMRAAVDRIERALKTVDADHAPQYEANAQALRDKLSTLDNEYRTGLADCRLEEAVTGHAAFGYLAKRYGFTQVPVAGLSPESEPSIARLREITDLVRAKGIKAIFFETLVSPKLAQTLAEETGATTLVFNPLEGLTEEEQVQGKDYFSIMQENLRNLRRGLECV